ncbi:MAG: ABC transporter ATP-binding protein [Pseudomonadota bacterium]
MTTPTEHSAISSQAWAERPKRVLVSMLGIRPLRGLVIVLIYAIKASPLLMLPMFIEHTIATLSDPSDPPLTVILGPALVLLAFQLGNIPSHTLFMHMVSKHIRDLEQRLRTALIRQLQYLTMTYHHRKQSGELQAKVLRDVEQVENLVRLVLVRGFDIVLMIGFAVVVTLIKEPIVLGFYLVAAPLSFAMIGFFRNRLSERNQRFRKEVEDMSSSVSEMIDMIPVTKAHGLEQQEITRVEQNLKQIHRKGHRLDRLNAVFESSTWVTLQVTQVICLVFTSVLATRGVITVAEVVLYQFLFGLIVTSVTDVLLMVPYVTKGLASLNGLSAILSEEELESSHAKVRVADVQGRVEFDDVSYSYGDGWAVKNLSFVTQPGECIAFVGESGSGKSTIMNMITGFFHAQEGRVLLDGVDQRELDLQAWRQSLAVVTQSVLLFSGSMRDNICYGIPSPDEKRLRDVVKAARLEEVVADLPEGLDTAIGENGVRLSGGQRQRIAIARALMRDPKIIILDEATSSLDMITEKKVQEAIDTLVQGRTTFIVAHRLSTIRNADRIIVMKAGEAVERGSLQALADAGGEFAALKALQ